MQIEVRMKLERTTKGAVRYQEVDAKDNPVGAGEFKVGTMYVRKHALPKEPPENIVVIIGQA